MNETANKDSSIFSWFWHWLWIMGGNPYGLINSQLIIEVPQSLEVLLTRGNNVSNGFNSSKIAAIFLKLYWDLMNAPENGKKTQDPLFGNG